MHLPQWPSLVFLALVTTADCAALAETSPNLTKRRFFCARTGDPSENVFCWEGYKQEFFHGSHISNCAGALGCCLEMDPKWEIASLLSAKVTKGSYNIALFTGSGCTGSHQIINKAGYRDMSQLPPYKSWGPAY